MKQKQHRKDKSMNEQIRHAVNVSQRAQRNYDLTKSINEKDLDTFIHVAANSPSKQNETHYELHVFTNQKIIREIYDQTKLFLLMKEDDNFDQLYGEKDGKFWQSDKRSVHNSQVLANALFVYFEQEGEARGGTHKQAQSNSNNKESLIKYHQQIGYSIGVSAGQLVLSAALLGYKTGFCSAFKKGAVAEICNTKKMPKLLVGVGHENAGVDRRYHAETLNKDIPEGFKNGLENEKWRFPSFEKDCKVFLNDSTYY